MRCNACGAIYMEEGVFRCTRCSVPLAPDCTVQLQVKSSLSANQDYGLIHFHLTPQGARMFDAGVRLESALFRRTGHRTLENLGPTEPRSESIQVELAKTGAAHLKVILGYRCSADGPVCCFSGTGEIEIRTDAGGDRIININTEKYYQVGDNILDAGGAPAEAGQPILLAYDERESIIANQRPSCPFCREIVEKRFRVCTHCGMDVPTYIRAHKETLGKKPLRLAPTEEIALRSTRSDRILHVTARTTVDFGRHRANHVRLLVEPLTEENKKKSLRISRFHGRLSIEEENPVLHFRREINIGGRITRSLPLDEKCTVPIADVLRLEAEPFYDRGEKRWHLATDLCPIVPDPISGSRPGIDTVVLRRSIHLGLDSHSTLIPVTSDENPICRLVRLDQQFWIEPVVDDLMLKIDDTFVPGGTLALLLPGQYVRSRLFNLRVEEIVREFRAPTPYP